MNHPDELKKIFTFHNLINAAKSLGKTTVFDQSFPARLKQLEKWSELAEQYIESPVSQPFDIAAPIKGKRSNLSVLDEHEVFDPLKQVFGSKAYRQHKSSLAVGLGTVENGEPLIVDLCKTDIFIAGAERYGISAAVNAAITGMLLKTTPRDLRLIIIDRNKIDLNNYDSIPHLLTPVINQINEAVNSLFWCAVEAQRRHRLMRQEGVRTLTGLNKKSICSNTLRRAD